MNKKVMFGITIIGGLLLSGCTPMLIQPGVQEENALEHKTISLAPQDTITHIHNGNMGIGVSNLSTIVNSVSIYEQNHNSSHPKYFYPTEILGNKIIASLSKKYNMIPKPMNQPADYTLEVESSWRYKNNILYGAQVISTNAVDLKDTKTNKVVARVYCGYDKKTGFKTRARYPQQKIIDMTTGIAKKEALLSINLCAEKFNNEILR